MRIEQSDIEERIDIMAEDRRPLYHLRLSGDGITLEISTGMVCKVGGVLYGDTLEIIPYATNLLKIRRPVYK